MIAWALKRVEEFPGAGPRGFVSKKDSPQPLY